MSIVKEGVFGLVINNYGSIVPIKGRTLGNGFTELMFDNESDGCVGFMGKFTDEELETIQMYDIVGTKAQYTKVAANMLQRIVDHGEGFKGALLTANHIILLKDLIFGVDAVQISKVLGKEADVELDEYIDLYEIESADDIEFILNPVCL